MNKVIYTAIFGTNDELKEPMAITPGWDYICFTDQDLKSNVWQIRKMVLRTDGPARTARHVKINFHKYIEADFSIWIDASYIINCNLDEWWKRFIPPFTCIKHPDRDCFYQEADAVISHGRDIVDNVTPQVQYYKALGLPEHNGLIASGILMRSHTKEVANFCETWWDELCKYSIRDQLSWPLVDWMVPGVCHKISWHYPTGLEFIYIPHKDRYNRPKKLRWLKDRNIKLNQVFQ